LGGGRRHWKNWWLAKCNFSRLRGKEGGARDNTVGPTVGEKRGGVVYKGCGKNEKKPTLKPTLKKKGSVKAQEPGGQKWKGSSRWGKTLKRGLDTDARRGKREWSFQIRRGGIHWGFKFAGEGGVLNKVAGRKKKTDERRSTRRDCSNEGGIPRKSSDQKVSLGEMTGKLCG